MTNFHELGLAKHLVATLSTLGYENPTPIQAQAIPHLLEGRDLIGLAQTGTGKTAAFGLPLIEMLSKDPKRPDNRTTRTLILAPTRELVNQIAVNLKSYVRGMPLKINSVVGGASINKQQQMLEKGTDILVATPGRLLDLVARKAIGLTTVRYLVLDEADQMLDLGFIHDLRKISKMVPKRRQTLLFSATMPKAIAELAGEYLADPIQVSVTPPGKAADKVEQYVHFLGGKNDKTELLKQTLTANADGRAIVFMRTKHTAEKLMKHLDQVGYSVASIHGNKSQGQRERALKGFREGEIQTLIATDVAARGIDIPGVTHVFNYDLPEVPDAYVHRIGRTARAGRDGIAIAFCTPEETGLLRDIEKLMGIEITTASGERPEGLNRPARGNNNKRGGNRGRGGNGQPAGGEGRPRRERPARKPFFAADGEGRSEAPERQAQPNGNRAARNDQRKEHRKGNAPAAHGAHESANQRSRNGHGRPAQKGSGNPGPVRFGGDTGGNEGRKRRPA
ncbi:ATP-dependent RNA helicase RhlE [Pseudorhizobium tarimense]|uniref:ATP-dependent RNA helicase RhlE n=1 Tax=Pseudorhizobium tarimense TaxID=1079109 RepID=A0ABV2H6K4_9HYPH|nr:DEAD/DEAH box helicase [Pseudorhizobium tarimense]MCJ8519495.1 DEAD/DEAH box helicase [Pseudorhizobium tarimense]